MSDAAGSTLLHCFLKWEREKPQAIYLTQPYPDGQVRDYSWAEVGQQARRMAAYLQDLQLPPASKIALLGKNSAHWIIADLAIMMAGHVSVPLYPTLSGAAARYILEHSEARLLFLGKLDGNSDNWPAVAADWPDDLPLIGLPLAPRRDIPQWDSLLEHSAPLQHIRLPDAEQLCTIAYTSGSTGQPKGVMHSYRSMLAAGQAMHGAIGASGAERMLSYLPLAHVAERAVVEATSLYFGFRVFFSNSLATFVEDVKRARPTIFFSVPRLWTRFYLAVNQKISPAAQTWLLALPLLSRLYKQRILSGLGLDQTRVALTGSAPLAPDILAWYRRLGLELLDVYGMSENFGISHVSRPGQVRPGYVGTCLQGVEARIDPHGELLVKSPGQMLGYYKLPGQSAHDLLPDGFFRTGDRGEFDQAGRLRITGRVKELFKTSGGKYVAPAPLESRLASHPQLEAACVTGPGCRQPFALLLPAPDVRQAAWHDPAARARLTGQFQHLLAQVNAGVESHEKLACLVLVRETWTIENGFLTPTLKIKRDAIERHYLAQAPAWQASGQAVIWEE